MHTQRERMRASRLVRRTAIKRQLSHYIRQFFRVLSSFRPVIWFLSLQLMYPSAKMDLKVKASGRSKAHCGLE